MSPEKIPQWAKDRMEADAEMGEFEGSSGVGFSLYVILTFLFETGVIVAACAIIYMVGRWAVGS